MKIYLVRHGEVNHNGTSENIKKFFNRIYNFLDELKTKDYRNILIVAHIQKQ